MKKSLIEILNVSPVFRSLTTKRFNNFSLSYKIAKASKELDEKREFYINEERKIVDELALKDEKTGQIKFVDGNKVTFQNSDDAMKFNERVVALQKTEVDIFDTIKIDIRKDIDMSKMDLTPSDILTLEGFVDFVEEVEEPVKQEVIN